MVDRVKGASRSLELLYEAKPNGTQDSLENEDFIGLIAYGLYKIEQREWAKKPTQIKKLLISILIH